MALFLSTYNSCIHCQFFPIFSRSNYNLAESDKKSKANKINRKNYFISRPQIESSYSINWREPMKAFVIFILLLAGLANGTESQRLNSELEVLVQGVPVSHYYHKGTTYLEALKGKEYAIRITNPVGSRIAVALSVDGLNTIDARHTDARQARKWVLEPYQSIIIKGWQTNAQQARRFFFTTEERSYGARMNNTENLGIISAVFFKERIPPIPPIVQSLTPSPRRENSGDQYNRKDQEEASAAAESKSRMDKMEKSSADSPSEYAATGIGNRIRHEVYETVMDLEDKPFAIHNLRYEFRPALIRLGILSPQRAKDPLPRREQAQGFQKTGFCPEP
jgi:hypothetical protein